MTPSEAKHAREQLSKFDALTNEQDRLRKLLAKIDSSNKGPFTGDYKESRKVLSLDIAFSETNGGSPEAGQMFSELHISAHRLGKFLHDQLSSNLKLVNEEIAML